MKLFQKAYPLVGILLLSGGIFLAKDRKVLTTSEVLSLIDKRSDQVFPQGKNLFVRKKENTYKWYKMLNDIQNYVLKNTPSNRGLLQAFSLCWVVSNELINILDLANALIFTPPGKMMVQNIRDIQDDITRLVDKVGDLDRVTNEFIALQSPRPAYEGVRKTLVDLLQILYFKVVKLQKDFEKQVIKKFGKGAFDIV